MLTYATLTNEHIPLERLPMLQWSLFSQMQDNFEAIWDALSSVEISISDKAQSIESFATSTAEDLKHADKWGITRWPSVNPLQLIAHDMVQRLILRYEFIVTEAKQQALEEIIQETAERFSESSHQIKDWFEKHKTVATPDALVRVRIDVSENWLRSGMPKSILAQLKALAVKYIEQLPAPCVNFPRNMSNLREATQHLVEESGGQLAVARETGIDQGNLSKHLRSFSKTPLNIITRVFERAITFPRLRSKTERDGLKGKDSWLLFQENCPSVAEAIHHRFATRLLLSRGVLPLALWRRWAQLETRFVYPMLPTGIRSDLLSSYEDSLEGFKEPLIDNNRVHILSMDSPWQTVEEDEVFLLLLILASPLIPVQTGNSGIEQYTKLIGHREVFLVAGLHDFSESLRKWQVTGERHEINETIPYERIEQLAPYQIRLTTTFAYRWWLALCSEEILPASSLSYRWVSFCGKFSQWLTLPDLCGRIQDTLDGFLAINSD